MLRASSSRTVESRNPRSSRISAPKDFSSRKHAQKQMFGSHVLVPQPLGFFGGVVEDALALLAEGNLYRSGNAFPDGDARFNLFANGFDRAMGAQKAIRERLVLAKQP